MKVRIEKSRGYSPGVVGGAVVLWSENEDDVAVLREVSERFSDYPQDIGAARLVIHIPSDASIRDSVLDAIKSLTTPGTVPADELEDDEPGDDGCSPNN